MGAMSGTWIPQGVEDFPSELYNAVEVDGVAPAVLDVVVRLTGLADDLPPTERDELVLPRLDFVQVEVAHGVTTPVIQVSQDWSRMMMW